MSVSSIGEQVSRHCYTIVVSGRMGDISREAFAVFTIESSGANTALTGNSPPRPQTAPSTAVLAVKLALGVALLLMAERQRRRMSRPRKRPGWMARLDKLSPWSAVALAAFLQPWALVAAGAVTVSQAKLASVGSYLALVGFCLLATSGYLYLELYVTFAGARADTRLRRLRDWLDSHQDQVIIAVCLLLGLWLVGQSMYLLVA